MKEPDDGKVGFNLNTQKLHCLIMLRDELGEALSGKAGVAFFRAFVVEDRTTGEIVLNQRFRYKHGDSWYRLKLGPEQKQLSREEQIEYLAGAVEKVIRTGLEVFAGGQRPPMEAIRRFYPPNPDDSEATLDWLIAQDLVEMTAVVRDGEEVPVSKGTDTVT